MAKRVVARGGSWSGKVVRRSRRTRDCTRARILVIHGRWSWSVSQRHIVDLRRRGGLAHVGIRHRVEVVLMKVHLGCHSTLLVLTCRCRCIAPLVLVVVHLGLLRGDLVALGGRWLAVLLRHLLMVLMLMLLLIMVQNDSASLRETVVLLLEGTRAGSRRVLLEEERVNTRVWLVRAKRWRHGKTLLVGESVDLRHERGGLLFSRLRCRRRKRRLRRNDQHLASSDELQDIMLIFLRKNLKILRSDLTKGRLLGRYCVLEGLHGRGSSSSSSGRRAGSGGRDSSARGRRAR